MGIIKFIKAQMQRHWAEYKTGGTTTFKNMRRQTAKEWRERHKNK